MNRQIDETWMDMWMDKYMNEQMKRWINEKMDR